MNYKNQLFQKTNIKYLIAILLTSLTLTINDSISSSSQIIYLILSMIGILILFNIPSKWIEDSFAIISYKLKISSAVAGGLFLAIASSTPEFFTSASGVVWYKIFNIGFDTIIWSGIFNLCVIIGVGTFYKQKLFVRKSILKRDMPSLGISIFVLLVLALDGVYSVSDFIILISIYIVYIIILYFDKSKPYKKVINNTSNFKIVLKLVGGLVLIAFLAHSMISIGQETIFQVEKYYKYSLPIGVLACTIYGPGTSIADLFMSIAAIKKGEDTAAIVNGISSNTFDLTICIGVPGLVYTLMTGNNIMINLHLSILIISMLLVSFFIVFMILRKGVVTKKSGIFLLVFYGACTIIYLVDILY